MAENKIEFQRIGLYNDGFQIDIPKIILDKHQEVRRRDAKFRIIIGDMFWNNNIYLETFSPKAFTSKLLKVVNES